MSFKIDKQTLTDLAVFGTGKSQSVYEIFNRTHTRGGARLLEEMFQYPLSDLDAIESRSKSIAYYLNSGMAFPFRGAIFDSMEFYLNNTDTRTQLMAQDNTLGRKVKNMMGSDTDYTWIHNGIMGCLEMLNTLADFFQSSTEATDPSVKKANEELKKLLDNEKWNWYHQEKGKKKVSYEQAVKYDRVFRFEERDKLFKMMYNIFLMDVYITVGEVSKERGFVFAKALPPEENVLKLTGVFHPFLKKPIGNTIHVDGRSNVIFLTGANMAGKSTFMKSFTIALFLAHAGISRAGGSDGVFRA